jgi:hypothetical protein
MDQDEIDIRHAPQEGLAAGDRSDNVTGEDVVVRRGPAFGLLAGEIDQSGARDPHPRLPPLRGSSGW